MSDVAAGSVLGAGNPAPAVAAAGGESAPVADGWVSSLPESVRGVVLNKGWKAPEDAITSYANLEKLLGADKAGRGVVLPKDDAGADEWGQFWNRLGRPEAADQYNIPLPDGDDGGFAKQAATWFHEAGLTQRQAEGLAGKWNEFATGMQRQQEEAFAQQAQIDVQDLQREWGQGFDQQAELARRAIREAGLSPEEGQAIERALGVKKAAQVFSKLGQQYAEAPVKGTESGRGSFATTPEQAMARIGALKADIGWTQKYLNGDTDARAEFERLHKIAFPGTE